MEIIFGPKLKFCKRLGTMLQIYGPICNIGKFLGTNIQIYTGINIQNVNHIGSKW